MHVSGLRACFIQWIPGHSLLMSQHLCVPCKQWILSVAWPLEQRCDANVSLQKRRHGDCHSNLNATNSEGTRSCGLRVRNDVQRAPALSSLHRNDQIQGHLQHHRPHLIQVFYLRCDASPLHSSRSLLPSAAGPHSHQSTERSGCRAGWINVRAVQLTRHIVEAAPNWHWLASGAAGNAESRQFNCFCLQFGRTYIWP